MSNADGSSTATGTGSETETETETGAHETPTSANDGSTIPLRRYLDSLGYATSGWEQGFNFGPRAGVLDEAKNHLIRTFESTGKKVSLIGWSLGGVYARELSKEFPHMVRCVITLGTPFAGSHRSTNAWRVYELTSGHKVESKAADYDLPVSLSQCQTLDELLRKAELEDGQYYEARLELDSVKTQSQYRILLNKLLKVQPKNIDQQFDDVVGRAK